MGRASIPSETTLCLCAHLIASAEMLWLEKLLVPTRSPSGFCPVHFIETIFFWLGLQSICMQSSAKLH